MSQTIIVHTTSRQLIWPGGRATCAVGKNGVTPESDKREGDGCTPLGRYPLRRVYYRADRHEAPVTALPVIALEPDMGWCDAPGDVNYNRPIRHPYPASAEHLWREDGLYDIIVELGHNDAPVVPGLGSAIFLHCCTYDDAGAMKPTLGCVAMAQDELVHLLAQVEHPAWLEVRQ